MQIWDTAGEKQAHLLDRHFWSNAAGAIIVCNLYQADCVCTLKFWQDKLHQVGTLQLGDVSCLIRKVLPIHCLT